MAGGDEHLDAATAAVMALPDHRSARDQWLDEATQYVMGLQEPSLGQKALSAVQGLGAGALGSFVKPIAELPKTISQGIWGDSYREPPAWDPLSALGRAAGAGAEALTPDNPLLAQGKPFEYGSTVGAVVPALSLAFFGRTAAAVGGALQAGGIQGADAASNGSSGLGILGATAGGYIAGGALSGGVASTIENIMARSGGSFARGLGTAVGGGGAGMAFNTLSNAIHNWATDDEVPLLQNAGQATAVGLGLGSIVAAATEHALAMRARTGRRMTGDGWTGEMMPEDFPGYTPVPGAAEAFAEGGANLEAQFQSNPEVQAQRAVEAGAAFREANAHLYPDPAPPATPEELAQRPRPSTRDIMANPDESVGAPIYHPITGDYIGNEPVEPKVAPPIPDNRRTVPGKPRDIMVLPEEHTPGYLPVWNGLRGEWETPGAPKPDVNRHPSKSVDQNEPNTSGIARTPDQSSMESTQVAPAKGGLNVGRGAPKPYVPPGPEPGIAYQRDESMLYAPTTRPDYSKLANPVTDPLTGRTIVSDIGTPTNGGTGLRVTTEDTYKARGVMLRTDVIGAITKAAQQLSSFALRTGLVPPHSSGLYDPQTKEARIAKYGDIIAAAHEAGHAIETTAFGHEWSPDRQANWPKIEQELTRLGKTLYPDSTPHNGHVSEGFAEFEKLWLLQSEDIVRLAPETTNWHDTVFLKAHPEFDSALNAARESGDQYRFQGSAKRTQPVDPTSWAIRFRTSNFGELFRSFRTAWIDTAESLYELDRAAVDAGHLFETGKRAIDVFTAKRGTSDGVLDYFINRGTFDIARQRTGDSLSDVLAKVREANRGPDFRRYLKLRAEQWRNETKTVTDPTTGQRVVAAEEIPTLAVDMPELANLEAKNPAFRGASDGVLSWWDRVMSYVGDHDPVLKRAIEQMRQSGEFYMPLHRWLEGSQPQARGGGTPGGKRALTHGEIGKRSGGSKRETIDPLTSLVRDARAAIEVAHRRAVYNAVKDNALEAGLSTFVTDVTTKMRQDSGSLPFKPGESYGMPAGNLIAQQIFSTGTIQHPDGPIVPTLEARTMPDGTSGFEIRYYQFDPRLHDAVMSMDPNQAVQAMGILGTTLRMSRNLFVLGAVGWNPAFMLLGNPIRDAQALYVNSRNSPHLFSLIPQLVYEHSRVALHQISQGKIPYVWNDAFEKLGLDKTNPYSTYKSAGATARTLTNGGRASIISLDSPQKLMHVFGQIMGVTERGTRIWELKHTAAKVGWNPGEPMSPEQAVAMAVDAKQVTVDFQAGGSHAQALNRILPFFNVLFQGPRAYVRGPKDAYYAAKGASSGGVGAAKGVAGVAKSAFTLRNLSLMGLGAALWYRYKDEDWMRSMPADERFRNWFIPLPDGPDGEKRLARIPLSQEAALPIKLFEFALDAMHTKDPYSTSQYVSAFLQNFVPQANPIVAEAIEQATNSRTLSGESQIVPDKQKYLLHKDQISPYDGRFAIVLGGAMHVAPSRITHALENLFGSAGSWVGQRNFFGLLGPATNEQDPDSGSLMGSLTRKNGPISSSSRWVSDLYDLREVTERNYAVKVDADSVTRRLLAQNATQLVSLSHAIMENSPKMSQVDKQRMYSEVNAIAEDAVHQLRGDGKVSPQKAIQTRVQYEARSFQAKRQAGIKP